MSGISTTPSADMPPHATASTARAATPARRRKELHLLQVAEQHFAQFGFEGASLDLIAQDAGTSRHNLLYYFCSKEELYLRVLNDVLTQWLEEMSCLLQGDDPSAALRIYIRAKLQSSRERPQGSKVFTREVMAGAPRFTQAIRTRVAPALAADIHAFERWVAQGKIARVDFTHLMFLMWAMTQAYADQHTQFALLLGRPQLHLSDYEAAADLIHHMVMQALQPNSKQSAL